MGSYAKEMAEAVRMARDAVADLEEPLKTEAFKILLQNLLHSELTETRRESAEAKQSPVIQVRRPKKLNEKRDRKASAPVASELRLDVAALKKLKEYCERFELQGTEAIAFVLANFAREHAGLEFVTAGDMAYLHRQLISQRVKVAPVNNPGNWVRALRWLTAPSRRKEWLEKSGGGFAVSNSGLIRWQEMEQEQLTNRERQVAPKGK